MEYTSARNSSEGNEPKKSRQYRSVVGSSVGSRVVVHADRSNSNKIEYIKQQDSDVHGKLTSEYTVAEPPKLDVILLNAS